MTKLRTLVLPALVGAVSALLVTSDTVAQGTTYITQTLRIAAGTPYNLTWPADDGLAGEVLVTDGSGTLTWEQEEPVFQVWLPYQNEPPTSGFCTPATRNNHPVLECGASATEHAIFSGVLSNDYGGNGLTVDIYWMSENQTTGDVVWQTNFEAHPADAFDLDSDSFASGIVAADTTASATGEIAMYSAAHTDGAQIDSLAAGDSFRVRVGRAGGNGSDTMTNDAQILRVVVREP